MSTFWVITLKTGYVTTLRALGGCHEAWESVPSAVPARLFVGAFLRCGTRGEDEERSVYLTAARTGGGRGEREDGDCRLVHFAANHNSAPAPRGAANVRHGVPTASCRCVHVRLGENGDNFGAFVCGERGRHDRGTFGLWIWNGTFRIAGDTVWI